MAGPAGLRSHRAAQALPAWYPPFPAHRCTPVPNCRGPVRNPRGTAIAAEIVSICNAEKIMGTLHAKGNRSGAGAKIVGSGVGEGPGPDIMAADTLEGTRVVSSDGEDVGKI